VFNYVQNNANISGADVLLNYDITKFFSFKTRAMLVRGTNIDLKQPLIYMPADRYEASLTFKLKDGRRFSATYFEPGFLYVDKQYRVPENVDFVSAPKAYLLFGLNAGTTFKVKNQEFIFTLSITNAANTVYRDYLDRFRYYNDAAGSNYTLRLRIPFTLYDKK
jgi:iron complex outermembrane receptor protein